MESSESYFLEVVIDNKGAFVGTARCMVFLTYRAVEEQLANEIYRSMVDKITAAEAQLDENKVLRLGIYSMLSSLVLHYFHNLKDPCR